jgi:opacity protein-like surface antigen
MKIKKLNTNKPALIASTILSTLILSTSYQSLATPAPEAANTVDTPSKVSTLLKKLKKKTAQKPTKPKPKAPKKQIEDIAPYKPQTEQTVIKPEPIRTITPTTLERKRSLPDFVHNIYIRGDYGIGTPNKVGGVRFKKSPMYGVGIGYKFNQALRLDINYQLRDMKTKSAIAKKGLTNASYTLNAYLDLMDENSSYIVPFLAGGIGYSTNKFKNYIEIKTPLTTFGGKNNDITWNAGAGVSFKLTKNISINASYKYIDLGKFKQVATITGFPQFNTIRKDRTYAQEIATGLILSF